MKAFISRTLNVVTLITIFSVTTFAQLNLGPTINPGTLPADSDPICTIPLVQGTNFNTAGLSTGDTIPHFILYDINGVEMDIATVLQQGKPVLIVDGSYTCPAYRNKLDELNNIKAIYGNNLEIFIVYVIEAHPIAPDISPYFGTVHDANNPASGINILQPTTYGERKTVVQEMLNNLTIDVPVYIDGLCNEWWLTFGPAPNNAYLIDLDGVVYVKHGWFDKAPQEDMICDIDSFLNNPCSGGGTNLGFFDFNIIDSSTSVTGGTGATLLIEGQFSNFSSYDVIIDVDRLVNAVPVDWGTSICVDICLDSNISNTTFQLDAGQTQSYHMYFYTGLAPDSGAAQMKFENAGDPSNSFTMWFYGYSEQGKGGTKGTGDLSETLSKDLYPNPVAAGGTVNLFERKSIVIDFYNIVGEHILSFDNSTSPISISQEQFSPGVYLYKIRDNGIETKSGRLVVQ
ncbi:MAG: T9SS type A sorting domain-containing protein [Flavobacteriales bacterium]|nr:T9SS type A sorting domain-containing protein [Flavobacteriales bacterium]